MSLVYFAIPYINQNWHMKIKTSIFFLIFSVHFLFAQEMLNPSFEKYYRPSVTYIMLDNATAKYNTQMRKNFSSIAINGKFDDHRLENISSLKYDYNSADKNAINQLLITENIAKKVISKWYNKQANGSFSMDFIAKRGLYNASDYDVMRAKAGARGAAQLEDAGEELIKKSYIVAFDFAFVETWNDYYDRVDATNERIARQRKQRFIPTMRSQIGYRGSAQAFLYKVLWNDSLQQVFYENAWNNPAFFEKMTIPIQFQETVFMSNLDGSQAKFNAVNSDDQLAQILQKQASESALRQFAAQDRSLRVKNSVFETKPLSAKVGLKEDVKIDQRFFVYELVQGTDDKKVPHYKGVIRATKNITDNRNDATGTSVPTRFYQEAGHKLYKGMLIEQDYDIGGSFNAGLYSQRFVGPYLRLDINLAGLFNVSQLRLYIQGYLGFASVKFGNSPTSYAVESKGVEFGFSKTYTLLRNIHVEPYIGFFIDTTHTYAPNFSERAVLKNAKINIGQSQIGATIGLRIPINIKHNIQIVPAISINTMSFNSQKTLFGKTLPKEFPNGGMLNTTGNQQGANNDLANLGIIPYRYDISFRIKF